MLCITRRYLGCLSIFLLSILACTEDSDDIDLLGQAGTGTGGMTGAMNSGNDATRSSAMDMGMSGMLGDGGESPDSTQGLSDGSVSGVPTVYSLGVNLVELGGYLLPLQLEVVSVNQGAGLVGYERLSLRAVKDDNTSDIFAEVMDVEVVDGTSFVANFPPSLLPADFSPTGSDVAFQMQFTGIVQADNTVCGTVIGEITTIDQPLTMSTFGTELWETRGMTPPGACGVVEGNENCERLEPDNCPELGPGVNVFSSCGIERTFQVFLPENVQGDALPLVFMWHGLGSSADGLLERNRLADEVPGRGFILIAPESRSLPVEWEQLTTMDNADLAFFDDMVTCSQHRFNVDRERIYSTGLSGGGLWSTYLSMMRSDVIAAVAPLSGGLIVDYVLPTRRIPVLVTWGGPQDVSNEQNFETFARNLIADLQMGEHPIVTCDHGEGHEWNPLFNPWILDYLFAHTLSGDDRPFAAGLPEVFPAYCEVPSP